MQDNMLRTQMHVLTWSDYFQVLWCLCVCVRERQLERVWQPSQFRILKCIHCKKALYLYFRGITVHSCQGAGNDVAVITNGFRVRTGRTGWCLQESSHSDPDIQSSCGTGSVSMSAELIHFQVVLVRFLLDIKLNGRVQKKDTLQSLFCAKTYSKVSEMYPFDMSSADCWSCYGSLALPPFYSQFLFC